MARKSTMVTSIDGENGHPVYLCPETESFFRLLLNHRMEKMRTAQLEKERKGL